jgi:hypothetical protein
MEPPTGCCKRFLGCIGFTAGSRELFREVKRHHCRQRSRSVEYRRIEKLQMTGLDAKKGPLRMRRGPLEAQGRQQGREGLRRYLEAIATSGDDDDDDCG